MDEARIFSKKATNSIQRKANANNNTFFAKEKDFQIVVKKSARGVNMNVGADASQSAIPGMRFVALLLKIRFPTFTQITCNR